MRGLKFDKLAKGVTEDSDSRIPHGMRGLKSDRTV